MDEPRDPPPPAGSQAEAIPSAEPSPSPVQANDLYKAHAGACQRCRDIDRGRCEAGERMWRDWTAACDEAYRKLNDAAG